MKQVISWLLFTLLFMQAAAAQDKALKNYRNFPLVFSLQFHSLSYPLKDLQSNFKNVGIGIGTEIALGSKHNWAQQFQFTWYNNKHAGNGMVIYTQSAWRPTIASGIYAGLNAGFGYTYSFRPTRSYQQKDGSWLPAGHKGKWLFTVPLGVSLGYSKYSKNTYIAPFASYQVLVSAGYNKGIPVITNSLLQVGAGIHLSNNTKK